MTICALGSCVGPHHVEERAASRNETETAFAARAVSGASGGEFAYVSNEAPRAWSEPGFEQRYTGVDFKSVIVTDRAIASSGEWESVRHESVASFTFMHLAAGTLDRYALLGVSADDEIIVETWTLEAGEETNSISGALLRPKAFKKKRVFQGASRHEPRGIELDPEGRFVLFILRSEQNVTSVYQLDLSHISAGPVELASSSITPELSDVCYVQKFDHVDLGRVYVLGTNFVQHRRVLFIDADNNGIFDGSPLVGDDSFFRSQGLDAYEDWINLDR